MTNIFKKAIEAYEQNKFFGDKLRRERLVEEANLTEVQWKELESVKDNISKTTKMDTDSRYNVPKESPKASEELVTKTIEDTEIYRRAKGHILNAQRKQVAYGIDKYPEPLNADTWSTIETIDHIIDESIDKLHYLVMLRIKLEREYEHNQGKKSTLYADGKAYMVHTDGVECPPPPATNDEVEKMVGDVMRHMNRTQTVNSIRRNDGMDSIRYAVEHYLQNKENRN